MPLYEFPYGLNFVPFGANPEPYGKTLPDCRQVSVFLCTLAALFFKEPAISPFISRTVPGTSPNGASGGRSEGCRPGGRSYGEAFGAYPAFAPEPERADRFRLYGVQGGPVREERRDTGSKKVPRAGDFFYFGGGVPFFFCGAVLQ